MFDKILIENLYYDYSTTEIKIDCILNKKLYAYRNVVCVPTMYDDEQELLNDIKINNKYSPDFNDYIDNIIYENSIDLSEDFEIIKVGKYYHIKMYSKYCEV